MDEGRAAELAELAELRRRVYGPDADPAGPDAARLRDLESGVDRRPRTRTRSRSAPGTDGAPTPPGAAPHDAPDRDDDPRTPTATHPASSRGTRAHRRRTGALWVATLAVAVVVTAVVTTAVVAADAPAGTGGTTVAVLPLHATPEGAISLQSEPDTATERTDDFHGMTVDVLPPTPGVAQFDGGCLQLIDRTASTTVLEAQGCGAGAFPARVAITVTDDLPEEFRAVFPVGTSLDFVQDGRTVVVRTDRR